MKIPLVVRDDDMPRIAIIPLITVLPFSFFYTIWMNFLFFFSAGITHHPRFTTNFDYDYDGGREGTWKIVQYCDGRKKSAIIGKCL